MIKRENQALRLAQMMQNRVTTYPIYEWALPLIKIGYSELEKLSVDDVVLLGGTNLVFVLIQNNHICAELVVKVIAEKHYLEIINIDKKLAEQSNSKKYKIIKISLGKIQSRHLDIGYRIDITQRSLQDVTVIVEGNKYASGSLINVNGELAVMIEKVE